MAEMNFDAMGRFIYGAARFGGDLADVEDWMAADLGMARPLEDDKAAKRALYEAFFAKYHDLDSLSANHQCFMTMLKERPPSVGKPRKKEMPRRTETPEFIASHSILWLRPDGTEVLIEAKIGKPYRLDAQSWACPASLDGVDGRYPDIVSVSSLHAMSLALGLVLTRLGHMLADNATLVYPEDRSPWDASSLKMLRPID